MQNDINFRGYVGGPLLGTAQSIAVYQNGMRINESFGEVVQWDLVPDFATHSMQIFTGGDPIFGQNALGGAITMEMKNGFNFQGANLTTSGVIMEERMRFLNMDKNLEILVYIWEQISITTMGIENILNHI